MLFLFNRRPSYSTVLALQISFGSQSNYMIHQETTLLLHCIAPLELVRLLSSPYMGVATGRFGANLRFRNPHILKKVAPLRFVKRLPQYTVLMSASMWSFTIISTKVYQSLLLFVFALVSPPPDYLVARPLQHQGYLPAASFRPVPHISSH